MSRNASSQNKIGSKPFISTWRTTNTSAGSSTSTQVKLPLLVTGKYNFTVNWGDGSSNLITVYNQAEVTHTYAVAGDYTIQITGTLIGWQFNNTGDRLKILTITQWGALKFLNVDPLGTLVGCFYGCTNLSFSSVSDTPNFKNVTQLTAFLRLGVTSTTTTVDKINKWDVSKVVSFRLMFRDFPLFNGNIGNWNMSRAIDLQQMLYAGGLGKFTNGGSDSIKNWDVSNVTDMSILFAFQPLFNIDISSWNVSNVTNFYYMFGNASGNIGTFNQNIGGWNVAKGTSFSYMFNNQPLFNQDLSSWNMGNAINISGMFYAPYNGPGNFTNGGNPNIKNWNTSKVTDMAFLFHGQNKFNHNIGSWDVSKVTNLQYTLGSNSPMTPPMIFNNGGSPDINNWNTVSVVTMTNVFRNNPGFNQAIGSWNVSNATAFLNILQNTSLSIQNYSNTLIGWASRPVKPNISINNAPLKYNSSAIAARAILTSAPNNWTISDGGLQP